MERKNTILLTVIAVATLLVAVVGATFAYFSAANSTTPGSANVDVDTQKMGGTKFNFTNSGDDLKSDTSTLNYPGGIGVVAAKAVGGSSEESTTNNYEFSYKLKISSTSTTTSEMKWYLYESTNKNIDLSDIESTCRLVKDEENTNTYYYYSVNGASQSPDKIGENDCNLTNISSIATTIGGSKIAEGTVSGTTVESTDESLDDQGILNNARTLTSTGNTAGEKYYYLVVEYPAKGDQNTDAGNNINVTVELVESSVNAQLVD